MTITGEARPATAPGWLRDNPLLSVRDLECTFRSARGAVQAVRGVTFDLLPGETLGLVGESGCGKTTTGRAILRLPPPQSGEVRFTGRGMDTLKGRELRRVRRDMPMVFQDALSAFNPRRRVVDIVAEGLRIMGVRRTETRERVAEALSEVGMSMDYVGKRRPHEFSGGQCQRIAIARALAVRPKLIICDEPVASLDVSVQAQVLGVLQDVRENNDLSMIFISHDLAVVRNVSDRVAVMHRGRIVEIGAAEQIYGSPCHPYTRRLMSAVPVIDADVPHYEPPVPDYVDPDWASADYPLTPITPGHFAALSPTAADAARALF